MDGYPKQKYSLTGGSITVTSPEHEKSMGPGWVDHPPTPAPKRKAKEMIEAT